MARVGSQVTVLTMARGQFRFAMGDVQRLLALHDAETKRRPGRPNPDLEVFKRAGVILAVTAWETFIEDTLSDALGKKLAAARTPKDVQSTFNAVANAWLSQKDLKPLQLAEWALDGWKEMLRRHLQTEIEALNTPNSANIARLTKRYLGEDVTAAWRWRGLSALSARRRLDLLIALRGSLVHKAKGVFEPARVRRRDVSGAIALLNRLAQATEETLGRQPRASAWSGGAD